MITQRYGALEVAYTTQWRTPPYFDAGLPATEGSRRALGSVFAHRDASTWSGNVGGLLVKDLSSGQDLLKPPVDFKKVGRFEVKPPFGTVWRPVPPAGYVALGDVAIVHATVGPNSGPVKPDAAELGLVCVKQTHDGRAYVRRGELGRLPLRVNGSGKALWAVTTPLFPADDTEERLLLPAAVDRADHDTDLTLPSYNPPPAQSIVTDRTVTVPYHMVRDDGRTEAWKVANSPFYKVQRKRRYDLVRHVDFRGAGGGTILEAIQQGVSQETGQEFSQNVGISVGVTVGVEASAKPFGLGASAYAEATVGASLELGYTSRYSVSTFENKTVSVSYDVPAGRAGALWTDTHLLVPVRGDGTLVTNANLKLNSGSYVGRTFPHLDGTKIVVARTFSDEEIKAAKDMGIDPKILTESDVTEIQQ